MRISADELRDPFEQSLMVQKSKEKTVLGVEFSKFMTEQECLVKLVN